MALFRVSHGPSGNLPSYHEGYCYFTTDDGRFHIDTIVKKNDTDQQVRLMINPHAIVGLDVSGKVITYTKNDGTTGTITTQDTDGLTIDLADVKPGSANPINADSLGGQKPEYFVNQDDLSQFSQQMTTCMTAEELLMNGNFANPVNLNGQTHYNPPDHYTETLTGWEQFNGTDLYVENGYIKMSGTYGIVQTCKKRIPAGTPLTFALYGFCENTNPSAITLENNGVQKTAAFIHKGDQPVVNVCHWITDTEINPGSLRAFFTPQNNGSVTHIFWMSLRIGTYSAEDFLLPMQPNQREEMLRMGLPVQAVNLLTNSNFTNPVKQADVNDLHNTTTYVVDRWINANAAPAHSDVEGLIVNGETDLIQRLEHYDVMAGKTYTFAIRTTSGISCTTFIMGGNASGLTLETDITFFSVPDHHILVRQKGWHKYIWAALYEGAYTLETLPPYRPKDYVVELVECQRYLPVVIITEENEFKSIGAGAAISETEIKIVVPVPTSPRKTPVISCEGITALLLRGGSFLVPTAVSVDISSMNAVTITCTVSGAVVGAAYELIATPGVKLMLSSEL